MNARYSAASASWSSLVRPAGSSSNAESISCRIASRATSPIWRPTSRWDPATRRSSIGRGVTACVGIGGRGASPGAVAIAAGVGAPRGPVGRDRDRAEPPDRGGHEQQPAQDGHERDQAEDRPAEQEREEPARRRLQQEPPEREGPRRVRDRVDQHAARAASRSRASAPTRVMRRIPPTIGIPKNIRKPQPIEGPHPVARRVGDRVGRARPGERHSRPIRNEATDAAIQYARRLDEREVPDVEAGSSGDGPRRPRWPRRDHRWLRRDHVAAHRGAVRSA